MNEAVENEQLNSINDNDLMNGHDYLTKGTTKPHKHDVLEGRGGLSNHHLGNIYWRDLVTANKKDYVKMNTRKGKTMIARTIVSEIRSRNPMGRFLKRDKETGLWYDVGDERAREKTSQALREGAPHLLQRRPHSSLTGKHKRNKNKLSSRRNNFIFSSPPSDLSFHTGGSGSSDHTITTGTGYDAIYTSDKHRAMVEHNQDTNLEAKPTMLTEDDCYWYSLYYDEIVETGRHVGKLQSCECCKKIHKSNSSASLSREITSRQTHHKPSGSTTRADRFRSWIQSVLKLQQRQQRQKQTSQCNAVACVHCLISSEQQERWYDALNCLVPPPLCFNLESTTTDASCENSTNNTQNNNCNISISISISISNSNSNSNSSGGSSSSSSNNNNNKVTSSSNSLSGTQKSMPTTARSNEFTQETSRNAVQQSLAEEPDLFYEDNENNDDVENLLRLEDFVRSFTQETSRDAVHQSSAEEPDLFYEDNENNDAVENLSLLEALQQLSFSSLSLGDSVCSYEDDPTLVHEDKCE